MSPRDEGPRRRLGRLLPAKPAAEVDDELAFHLEQRARDYERQGMTPDEARRAAVARLGDVRDVRRECAELLAAERRTSARRERLRISWLDVKLGARMLVKYPGLTLIGGLAMAFALCVGAVAFQIIGQVTGPPLPLDEGDRVVRLAVWDAERGEVESRSLHDFARWRGSLRTLTDLGAYRDVPTNVVGEDGEARPVEAAEMTASGFRLARVRPHLGRALADGDERAGAPPVVVLGHATWQRRFGGDPAIVGRQIPLGDGHATVVGVMPEGFEFPVAHDLWLPLRADLLESLPREGPAITMFGRLAPGVGQEEARAELGALGGRLAAASPRTHRHLRPLLNDYTTLGFEPNGGDQLAFMAIHGFVVLLLVLVCCNVALLMFARAATREAELVVRSALGASRGRIVMQLFAEALVLGGAAAVVGIAAAHLVLQRWAVPFLEKNEGRLPFWYDLTLSPTTVLYAVALTVVGAAIAGVGPGLKVTRGLAARLKAGSAGGGGLRFGGVWTAVIVAQVAVTVAFPAVAYVMQREAARIRTFDVGFAEEEYLAMKLAMDPPANFETDSAARLAHERRFAAAVEQLRTRMLAEPGVVGATFASNIPRGVHGEAHVELDPVPGPGGTRGDGNAAAQLPEATLAYVDDAYFAVVQAPLLAGRNFTAAEVASAAPVAVVDQGFVETVLGGRNPVGRRVRFATERNDDGTETVHRWLEIVGVVPERGMAFVVERDRVAGLYLPAPPRAGWPLNLVVHTRGDPLALVPQARGIASTADATLRIVEPQRLDEVATPILWILGVWLRSVIVLSAIAMLLSLAGIYAVLSFTVARRTREIGVRIALGASRGRVLAAVFRRPLTQVAIGVVVGGTLILGATKLLAQGDGGFSGELSPAQAALLVAHVTLMFGVCLLACVVPTRRALRIEPTEALRADA